MGQPTRRAITPVRRWPTAVTLSGLDITLPDGGSIAGTVTDVTGDPLSNYYVYADGISFPYPWWSLYAITDGFGNYKIQGFPAREFKLYVGSSFHYNVYYEDKVSYGDGDILDMAAVPDRAGIDFVLKDGGRIRVAVFDKSGLPLHDPDVETVLDQNLRQFAEDGDGNLWVATDSGVMGIVDGVTSGIHPYNSDLPGEEVRAVSIDNSGNKYYATNGGVVRHNTDGSMVVFTEANSDLPGDDCTAILWNPNGNVYIGTAESDFIRWDGATDSFTVFDAATRGESSSTSINSLALDPADNDVYIGSFEGMTTHSHPSGFTNITTADGLPSNQINSIDTHTDGTVFLGTSSGLYIIGPPPGLSTSNYDMGDGLPGNMIYDVYVVDADTAWIATSNGISFWDAGAFNNSTTSNSNLYTNTCYSIHLWNGVVYIGQSQGLDIFDPSDDFVHIDRSSLHFNVTAHDPVQNYYFSNGSSSEISFEITGIAPGNYQLSTSPSYYPQTYWNHVRDQDLATLVSISEGQQIPAAFVFERVRIITSLIEGTFPNYEAVIPKKQDKEFVFNTDDLTQCMRRAAAMTNDKFRNVKLTFDSGVMRLSVKTPEVGEFEDELAVEYSGASVEIAFNPFFILDVLHCIESENVCIQLKDGSSPGVIKPYVEGPVDTYVNVIMPIRA